MLALSIRQPWAWLIVHGHKPVENRSWFTKQRGTILIHAGITHTRTEHAEAHDFIHRFAPDLIQHMPSFHEYPKGGIVGQVNLVDCVTDHPSPWFVGEYGFVVRDPKPLPFMPCKGALGFFEADVTPPRDPAITHPNQPTFL